VHPPDKDKGCVPIWPTSAMKVEEIFFSEMVRTTQCHKSDKLTTVFVCVNVIIPLKFNTEK
jgi:hypothetical protein